MKGVNWHTSKKAWRVALKINGKRLHGGTFKPKDSTPEEVERARLAALESRRKLEEKYFAVKQSEAPDLSCPAERKSGVRGVFWMKCCGEWRVQVRSKGNNIQR